MQEFPIAPGSVRGIWLLIGFVALVMSVSLGFVLASAIGARAARFQVSPEGLRLRGDVYGRLIPAAELRVDDARRVDFRTSPELTPRSRTLGTGLPGYQAGWFRLRSGEKALLFVTDRQRAVYVPTTAGYSVLLTPADPDGFIEALRTLPRRP
ncbi:MAG TPA: PH domain-containing protein [Vicinamibacterales bacterium]